jgi:YVTN family beta-propeller protein
MMCVVGILSPALTFAAEPLRLQPRLRRPIAMVATADKLLCVANRESGTISVLDVTRRKVVAETAIGKRLSDLVALPKTPYLLATDEAAHRLILLDQRGRALTIIDRLEVSYAPVSVVVTDDGRRAIVASLWSRRLTFVDIRRTGQQPPKLVTAGTLDLPFAPRQQIAYSQGTRLLVADAFGGRLAVVDLKRRQLLATRSLMGHNIRGLAVQGDEPTLLVAHQVLNERTSTTHEHVFWGGVIRSVIRSVPLAELTSDSTKPFDLRDTYPLGNPAEGAGDPGAVIVTSKGATVVALSGVNEVTIRPAPRQPFSRRKVGRRPTALIASQDGKQVYVANTFSDSISVIDPDSLSIGDPIPLGPQPKLSVVERGEVLFHDATLSLDGWYSCQSCHTDGHTIGLANDNFGDGYFGDPKRIPSLLGTGDTGPWSWVGGNKTLAKQIHKSLTLTMQGEHVTEGRVAAIAAYVKTLEPVPSVSRLRGTLDEKLFNKGRKVFVARGCAECHRGTTFTTSETYDVGLTDKYGHRKFNPPSLRGVSRQRGFFHDGQAKSLGDVFTKHRHPNGETLPDRELKALLEFLKGL